MSKKQSSEKGFSYSSDLKFEFSERLCVIAEKCYNVPKKHIKLWRKKNRLPSWIVEFSHITIHQIPLNICMAIKNVNWINLSAGTGIPNTRYSFWHQKRIYPNKAQQKRIEKYFEDLKDFHLKIGKIEKSVFSTNYIKYFYKENKIYKVQFSKEKVKKGTVIDKNIEPSLLNDNFKFISDFVDYQEITKTVAMKKLDSWANIKLRKEFILKKVKL